ncbi:antitoxin MazE family protein, partial [Rhodopseudomonas sp. B29]|uniref:antitoxin MazE family protein n=1 Tax=Rhodopseudomonas sp. B29 TaxID=95607 RepID=UPI0003B65709
MDKKVDKPATGKRGIAKAERAAKPRSASAERVRRHRDKMKAMGLKPVTIWVPEDYNSPEYKAEIKRACQAINADPESEIVLEGMLELADFSDGKHEARRSDHGRVSGDM